MKTTLRRLAATTTALLLAACASLPNGPSEMALPGTGRNFSEFRDDDRSCRQYATQQIGGATAQQAQGDSVVRSAAVGTAVGAVAGAAMGGRDGAGFGAGAGLIVGALSGSELSGMSAWEAQRRYDHAYMQCMYGAGHRIPLQGRLTEPTRPAVPYYPPPPPPPRR